MVEQFGEKTVTRVPLLWVMRLLIRTQMTAAPAAPGPGSSLGGVKFRKSKPETAVRKICWGWAV